MERRYDVLHEVGVRDIGGYNSAFDRGELQPEPGRDTTYERLPFVVVIIDELNDLMMVAARDVEESITRIAQMARAVGIHLVIATQRPSVNVITGVIKANIPARMAFAVSSLADSRVILDQPGAERLVGKGDLLLLGPASSVAQRIQGAWVDEQEIRGVVAHWRRQATDESHYVDGVEGPDEGGGAIFGVSGDDADDEALTRTAMELVVRSQLGSTSMLQRKLKVGFARAGRIMDLLEQRGIVGPSEGSKARAVLMTPEELDLLLEAERNGQ
jgi:S-DNA-T family DNA segregation ATPase FtsK/SpoIIIE